MALGIDTVFVWVTDLDGSLDWYRRFGVEPGPRYGDFQVMQTEGARFALHQGPRPTGDPTAVVGFGVASLETEIERVAGLGIVPIDGITDTGSARFITFADPDGNQIQLVQRTG
jgi:catechol 2,3-dioxygenase-like lactoylglutathione lyase family enzyme